MSRELRNLEQRGDRVDHPAGGSDDRADAVMLAAAMAVQTSPAPTDGIESRRRQGGVRCTSTRAA